MGRIEVDDTGNGVVTFWLDNPGRRNALNRSMLEALIDGIASASQKPRTRLIVMRGRHGTFCAGRDVSDLQEGGDSSSSDGVEQVRPAKELANALLTCPVPTLAAVSGQAVGLGMGIVVWCDLAIADRTSRFSVPEARIGIPPSMIALSLQRVVGPRAAADMVLRGRSLPAQEALAIGLIQQLRENEAELSAAVAEVAYDVCRCAPGALRSSKALMRELEGQPFTQAFEEAIMVAAGSLRRAEAVEGMDAFRTKRKPSWMQNIEQTT